MLFRNSDQSDGDSGSGAEESETPGEVEALVAEAQSKLPAPIHTYGSASVPLAPPTPPPAAAPIALITPPKKRKVESPAEGKKTKKKKQKTKEKVIELQKRMMKVYAQVRFYCSYLSYRNKPWKHQSPPPTRVTQRRSRRRKRNRYMFNSN